MKERFQKTRDDALKLMLKPIVRFWIDGTDTIQRFLDLLKQVFIEVAVEEIEARGEKVNASRLSVMTGVHRADVARIYKNQDPPTHSVPDIATRVIGKWEQGKEFRGKDGKPKELSCKGEGSDFHKLVYSVTTSLRPAAVLFELERVGAVKRTSKGIKLVYPSLRRTKDFERVINLVALDIQSLMSAARENIGAEGESPNHHIRTEYDNVVVKDLPNIRNWLRREGRKFHKRVRDHVSAFDQDISATPDEAAGGHVVFTSFCHIQEPLVVEESE